MTFSSRVSTAVSARSFVPSAFITRIMPCIRPAGLAGQQYAVGDDRSPGLLELRSDRPRLPGVLLLEHDPLQGAGQKALQSCRVERLALALANAIPEFE
jgi:hypothetical protein